MIPHPDVEITYSFSPILYLSSSMGSIYLDSLGVSYYDSFEPSSKDTLISRSVDYTSTSHPSDPFDDVHVKRVSKDDD